MHRVIYLFFYTEDGVGLIVWKFFLPQKWHVKRVIVRMFAKMGLQVYLALSSIVTMARSVCFLVVGASVYSLVSWLSKGLTTFRVYTVIACSSSMRMSVRFQLTFKWKDSIT